jgi:F-type H+-transporting ATPase subunit epsilon
MADAFQLVLATPDREVLREQVTAAQIPARNGYIGALPDHAALVAEMGTGVLTYAAASGRGSVAVNGGWLEILDNHVTVLADTAERAGEIDVARAERALKRAEARAADPGPDIDVERCLRALARALARLDTAGAAC